MSNHDRRTVFVGKREQTPNRAIVLDNRSEILQTQSRKLFELQQEFAQFKKEFNELVYGVQVLRSQCVDLRQQHDALKATVRTCGGGT